MQQESLWKGRSGGWEDFHSGMGIMGWGVLLLGRFGEQEFDSPVKFRNETFLIFAPAARLPGILKS